MKVSDEPPAYGDFNALPQIEIPPLPSGVTIKKVYTDFLTYMFDATRSFFKGSTPNGDQIWNRVEDMIVLVLAMPNGWDTPQQGFLREVVTAAKILPAADLDKRLEFVTEGEASVHYALAHTRTSTWLNEGTMFLVTDAGGSTVDSTLYECKSKTPLVLKEVCASECVQVCPRLEIDHRGEYYLTKYRQVESLLTVRQRYCFDRSLGGPSSVRMNISQRWYLYLKERCALFVVPPRLLLFLI